MLFPAVIRENVPFRDQRAKIRASTNAGDNHGMTDAKPMYAGMSLNVSERTIKASYRKIRITSTRTM